jgi:DNA modification methylase
MSQNELSSFIPDSCSSLLEIDEKESRAAIPELARDAEKMNEVEASVETIPTSHELHQDDARRFDRLDEDVGLVVTSPPYFDLKDYGEANGQLGNETDFEQFLSLLEDVWSNCFDALEAGGRLCIVVGDVLRSRSEYGRHRMLPLHSKIIEQCDRIGFDVLSPIVWHKIGNTTTEAGDTARFLGKPYEPGAAVENDIEYILLFRKPGGYRSPSRAQRVLSTIRARRHKKYFTQVWTDVSGEPQANHPAPYPLEISERLIRMYSFVGDRVFDPFAGSGTTAVAASKIGRDSTSVEIEPSFVEHARKRLENERRTLVNLGKMSVSGDGGRFEE